MMKRLAMHLCPGDEIEYDDELHEILDIKTDARNAVAHLGTADGQLLTLPFHEWVVVKAPHFDDLTSRLLHCIITCDEIVSKEDGMCDCARAIRQELEAVYRRGVNNAAGEGYRILSLARTRRATMDLERFVSNIRHSVVHD